MRYRTTVFVWLPLGTPPAHSVGWCLVRYCNSATESAAWFWLLRSYRQLNAAKYIVIGAIEERLPTSPYWRAEWKALGEG